MSKLRTYVKGSPVLYGSLALGRVMWYASLQLISECLTKLRGQDTLVGVDFLPERDDKNAIFEFSLVACLRFKNEAPYLREWLEYHLLVGVQHFVLYNNNSQDDYKAILGDYVARGIVTLKDWPTVPASPSAELDCITNFRRRSRWIAFIDADEFIVPLLEDSITKILDSLSPVNALVINWIYFGSCFHEKRPKGLVTAEYTRCNANVDKHVKTILNPRAVIKRANSHFWYYANGGAAVNELGVKVPGGFSFQRSAQRVVIHHYVHKSAEEFLEKARMPTRVDAYEGTRKEEALERAFAEHNEVENHTMTRFAASLAARCAEHLDGERAR